MLRNALLTIGIIAGLIGFLGAGVMAFVALGNPAPSAESDHASLFWTLVGTSASGVAMIIAAFFVP